MYNLFIHLPYKVIKITLKSIFKMEKLKNISKREIWLRAGVSPKTYDKYLNSEQLRYKTSKKIKDAIASILRELNEVDAELSNL